MTRPAKTAHLARMRDNQRRSRARRKEYLQELEQRLRLYELQGTEASAEVQESARKVLGENKHLRELLNRCGVTDAYIVHYLQPSAVSTPESSQEQMMRARDRSGHTGAQQLMLPRQATSSVWEQSQSTIVHSHNAQQLGVCPPDRHHHSQSAIPLQPAATQSNLLQGSPPEHMKSDSLHSIGLGLLATTSRRASATPKASRLNSTEESLVEEYGFHN